MAGKKKPIAKSEVLLHHRFTELIFGSEGAMRRASDFATTCILHGHGVSIEVREMEGSAGLRMWDCKELQMITKEKS